MKVFENEKLERQKKISEMYLELGYLEEEIGMSTLN